MGSSRLRMESEDFIVKITAYLSCLLQSGFFKEVTEGLSAQLLSSEVARCPGSGHVTMIRRYSSNTPRL
jgi:hypothetical protein